MIYRKMNPGLAPADDSALLHNMFTNVHGPFGNSISPLEAKLGEMIQSAKTIVTTPLLKQSRWKLETLRIDRPMFKDMHGPLGILIYLLTKQGEINYLTKRLSQNSETTGDRILKLGGLINLCSRRCMGLSEF